MEYETKLIITLVILHLVSWGYDALIGWLERRGYHEGYVSLFVVIGVAYTLLAGLWLVDLRTTLTLLAAFAASGLPMVSGSIVRHIVRRRREEEHLCDHARKMNGS
jgi:hypothetical protein